MPTVTRRMEPLPLNQVSIRDVFWAPRRQVNRRVTIPHAIEQCRHTGRLDALGLTWKPGEPGKPHIFWDSDIGKLIETIGYSLATDADGELERFADELIERLAAAQQPDGYLNVYYTVVEPGQRWRNLKDCHELYCAGHLIEGAVAYAQATGKRRLLEVMCRYADYIGSVFGTEKGKTRGYGGHEEIELALVKLFQATGSRRYLELSRYFVDERGQPDPHYFDVEAATREAHPGIHQGDYRYYQAHRPVREQDEVVGHAVRSMYLCAGMADVAAYTGDATLLAACRKLWKSATHRKMYVTGGVGATARGEAFTENFDLPNASAYAETCAAIGLVFFAHRMIQIEADARYADVMERSLYNGSLAGVSLDGQKFFYTNPLASSGCHHRSAWFGCACCPPNITRLIASLGHYAYSYSSKALYVHLYVGGSVRTAFDGNDVVFAVDTDYPWEGRVDFKVASDASARFDLMLRIPGWCRRFTLKINGKTVTAPNVRGYLRLARVWRKGDRIRLVLNMPVERIRARPNVMEAGGRVALQRGPIVYCLEQADHAAPIGGIRLPPRARLNARFDPQRLGGVTVIEGTGLTDDPTTWKNRLYGHDRGPQRKIDIRAVPYALWDNRAPGAMTVWIPESA